MNAEVAFDQDMWLEFYQNMTEIAQPFLPSRTVLAEVNIAGTTVPQGSPLVLILASGSRDPSRFLEPDRFDPTESATSTLVSGAASTNASASSLTVRCDLPVFLTHRRLELPRVRRGKLREIAAAGGIRQANCT